MDKNVFVENNADKYDLEVNNQSKKRVRIEEPEEIDRPLMEEKRFRKKARFEEKNEAKNLNSKRTYLEEQPGPSNRKKVRLNKSGNSNK
jgi:hypothetical protein